MASKGYAGSPQLCTCAAVTWNTNRGLTFSRVCLSNFCGGAQNFSQPPNSTFWTDKECSKECGKCVASEETAGGTKLLAHFYNKFRKHLPRRAMSSTFCFPFLMWDKHLYELLDMPTCYVKFIGHKSGGLHQMYSLFTWTLYLGSALLTFAEESIN